jgi:UDP-N-acetylglucosamine/UDP-N-acetylgalactosamine diphosphorylase
MAGRLATIRATLQAYGQSHLLAWYERLTPARKEALLDQLEGIDLERLRRLFEASEPPADASVLADLEPAPWYPRGLRAQRELERYRETGRQLVRRGKVAVFAVAGGQGTRLSWSGPKGSFPATVVLGKPVFRVLAEQILANQDRFGVSIPFYLMTSPLNDGQTRSFFQDNNWFGLNRRNVFMFPQRMLPSIDAATGTLLLADEGTVAMNPDGHGGSIRAMAENGALEDMERRGIEHISYVQVDNPLVHAVDPVFLGLHASAPDSSGEMSSKMVLKTDPSEKVGVLCRRGGRTVVIEYSDLPPALASARDGSGRLRFCAGSIAVHIIGVRFLQKLTGGDGEFALPVHRALRKVAHLDPTTGRRVEPAEPNAWKLETFVFDALPLARSSIVYETPRLEEFAPIKNATGVDSPATSHQLQSDRAGAWLERVGVSVPRDAQGHVAARIEIGPLTALEPQDLARARLPREIRPGDSIVL